MKEYSRRLFCIGSALLAAFLIWTVLIRNIDVAAVGPKGSSVGFSTFNLFIHRLFGVNMTLYVITDWLGLVPLIICFIFAAVGLLQLVKRRNLFKVDLDILILGVYYFLVILAYLIFEMIPINYRPILIGGFQETSYPSSTTLLVLSVMPTLGFECKKRFKNKVFIKIINIFASLFSLFMVCGRLVSGVHWFTDIVGSILFSIGLFLLFKSAVLRFGKDV